MRYLANIDLTKNQILNAAIQNLGTAPSSPVLGQLYYNTGDNNLYCWTGSWVALTSSTLTGASIVALINASAALLDDDNMSVAHNDAITKRHAQNTDSGTSSSTFQIGTGGPLIKNSSGTFLLRNTADSAYASIQLATATIDTIVVATAATLPTATTIGSGGPKIRNASGVVEIRNNADSAYAALKASGLTADTLSIATTAALPAGGSTTIGATTGTQIATAVTNSHVQGTDTGTSNASFIVGSSGIMLKNNAGTELLLRNAADSAYVDLRVNNLTVDGTTTTINSNTVNIGDNQITLNSDITTNATNSNGGIAVKRLKIDNTTRNDAEMNYNITTDKWETVTGAVATTLVTRAIANKYSVAIGTGASTSIVVTHGLNTRDVTVMVRESATPWNVVYPDIQMTTVDTITVIFAVAPASSEFTVTVIG